MPEKKDMINMYSCDQCGHKIVTINRDSGVTPFTISCQNEKCDEDAKRLGRTGGISGMTSSFYRIVQDPYQSNPTHEWYSPNEVELQKEIEVAQGLMREMIETHKGEFPVEDERVGPLVEGAATSTRDHARQGGLFLRELSNDRIKDLWKVPFRIPKPNDD